MTEQEFIERIISGDLNAMLYNLDLCIQEQADEQPAEPPPVLPWPADEREEKK